MTHYLEDIDKDFIVYKFEEFDADLIKECIINYFNLPENQYFELWLYKVNNDKKTVGDIFIDAFCFHKGKVCKQIQKGNRTFYKELRP